MIEHVMSAGPYGLLKRLNQVGAVASFDAASARILERIGMAEWDSEDKCLRVTDYGLTMPWTVRQFTKPERSAETTVH